MFSKQSFYDWYNRSIFVTLIVQNLWIATFHFLSVFATSFPYWFIFFIYWSLDDYIAKVIDGKFGILDIELEGDLKTLKASFIENGNKKKVLDEFKIIKDNS